MRKVVLLCCVLFTFSIATSKKLFVAIEYKDNCIKLDDGTHKKAQMIKDDNGKDIKFESVVGALNYMSLQGWELIETNTIVSGSVSMAAGGGSGSTRTDTYYIFYREVPDGELEEAVTNSYKK